VTFLFQMASTRRLVSSGSSSSGLGIVGRTRSLVKESMSPGYLSFFAMYSPTASTVFENCFLSLHSLKHWKTWPFISLVLPLKVERARAVVEVEVVRFPRYPRPRPLRPRPCPPSRPPAVPLLGAAGVGVTVSLIVGGVSWVLEMR